MEEGHEPLKFQHDISDSDMVERANGFLGIARRRRSVRFFSDRPVPRAVIESCIQSGGTAPSGANQQPWHFVAIGDAETKKQIRVAAEQEEHEFYNGRAPGEWLDVLTPIGTDEHKPFLEVAPWLIAIFAQSFGLDDEQKKRKHYYVTESVGIATGMLISALNYSGLATLTHTPSPMKFLNSILGRPSNERAFLLLVVGFPSEDCTVPCLNKKSLDELSTFKV
ncbi:MAG: nitroreductase family protein [Planctomycetota bacterium]|nr:nitroreductase family protein [Planctomycetota bacterium]